MIKSIALAALASVAFSGMAQAAVLTFTDATCTRGGALVTCDDRNHIDQNYGDLPGVDVSYGGPAIGGPVRWWGPGFSSFNAAIYTESSPLVVDFRSTEGGLVSIYEFEFGRFVESPTVEEEQGDGTVVQPLRAQSRSALPDVFLQVIDLADNSKLFDFEFTDGFLPEGDKGFVYLPKLFSSRTGIRLMLTSEDRIGLTNIDYSVEPPANPDVVPLPASAFLLLAGLGGFGALARRKRG